MAKENVRVTLDLPEEFLDLCEYDLVSPEKVLKQFIADLCSISGLGDRARTDGYVRNASEDGDRAKAYYDRLHGRNADWMRKNLPNLVKQWRAGNETS